MPKGPSRYTTENERTEPTVSAEKKAQTRADRDEKRRQEEQKDRRSMTVYTVVAVLVVVAAIAAMFWRSGVLQRSMTALDVNGTKYTAADLQYYYNSMYSENAQYYRFDSNTSVKKQVYDEATGQTWYDYLMDQAVQQLTRNTALAQQAKAEGYTLTEDTQAGLNSALAQLETAWIGYGYSSRDAYIQASFGPYMTYDRLVSLINMEYLASDYAVSKIEAIQHSDADFQTYYQEHADQLDTITYSQITFRCTLPTTDETGAAIQRTDEEQAAELEELKAGQKALAEEVQAKLNSGSDPASLAEEYADTLYGSSDGSRSTYANLAYFAYGDWLFDSERKAGDVTLIEEGTDTTYYYYVVRFEDRSLDQEETHNVRHLLVQAGEPTTTSQPSQEEYDQAEQKAQELLAQWKAGEATEESFTALVTENSDDSGSASSGGLISNITASSSYVESFRSWAIDPARKEGDVELVKSEYGWHIMYYVSTNDPIWKQNTAAALQNQDYEDLASAASEGWTITRGTGMNFVSA